MANITLAIPDSLHARLKKHNEIRWSQVIRQILQRNLDQMELADKIAGKSKLTQKDVDEISRKIKRGIAKRHRLR